MEELAAIGSFCPNSECLDYNRVDIGHIICYGKSNEGRQRFQCKTCRKTFNERTGSLFYQRKRDEHDIVACLALLAEGTRISSISRTTGIKEDTILSFLREAAQHAEQMEAILLDEYRISRSQIDGLWTYVGRKVSPKKSARQMMPGNTGGVP